MQTTFASSSASAYITISKTILKGGESITINYYASDPVAKIKRTTVYWAYTDGRTCTKATDPTCNADGGEWRIIKRHEANGASSVNGIVTWTPPGQGSYFLIIDLIPENDNVACSGNVSSAGSDYFYDTWGKRYTNPLYQYNYYSCHNTQDFYHIIVDTTKPTLGFAGASNNGYYNVNKWITPNSSDTGGSGLFLQQVGPSASNLSSSGFWTSANDNAVVTQSIYCYARDGAGNESGPSQCGTVTIDKKQPVPSPRVVSGTAGNNGWWISSITVENAGTDTTKVASNYVNDGSGWKTSVTISSTKTLSFQTTDAAGNVATISQQFKIDLDDPSVTPNIQGTMGLNNWYTSISSISATGTDSTSGIDYTQVNLNNNGWVTSVTSVPDSSSNYLQYRAYDKAGRVKQLSTIFKLDTKDPTPGYQIINGTMGANGWYTSDVTVRSAGSDSTSGIASNEIKINNGAWTTGDQSITTNGTHTIYYRSSDNAGRTASDSITIKIDKNAPTLGFTGADSTSWFKPGAVITPFSVDSASGIEIQKVSFTNGNWQDSLTVTETSDIYCYAKDKAGNEVSGLCGTVHIDEVAPVVGYTGETETGQPTEDNGWYNTDITITPNSSDEGGSGLVSQFVSDENGNWRENLVITSSSDIFCQATDGAGNTTQSKCGRINIDKIPPVLAFRGAESGGWYNADIKVVPASMDNIDGSGIESAFVSLDGENWHTEITVEESSTIYCKATDIAGNSISDVCGVVNIDKVAPVLKIKGITDDGRSVELGVWYNTNVTLFSDSYDTDGSELLDHQISLDMQEWYDSILITETSDIYCFARDKAHNEITGYCGTVFIDKNSPNVSFAGALSETWYGSDQTIFTSSTDDQSGIAFQGISLGDGDWQESIIAAKTSDVYCHTTDNAGNTVTKKCGSIWIDKNPPAVMPMEAGTLGNNGWYISPVTVTARGEDDQSGVDFARVSLDGEDWRETLVIDETNGQRVYVWAVDRVGNESMTSVEYKVDLTPPTNVKSVVESHALANDTWENTISNPVFTVAGAEDEGSGVYSYRYYFGTDVDASCDTETLNAEIQPGEIQSTGIYHLRISTVDGAGITSDCETFFTLKYDITPPEPVQAAVEIHGTVSDEWQNEVTAPVFTWDHLVDFGSGIRGFYVYWGSDPNGEAEFFTAENQFAPEPVSETGVYYLRIQAVDNLDNASEWKTAFIFRYDANTVNLDNLTTIERSGVLNDIWQNSITSPVFEWTGAVDKTSVIAGYFVYFGTDPLGESGSYQAENVFAPEPVQESGIYYLRIRAVNNTGNQSPWKTAFIFKYTSAESLSCIIDYDQDCLLRPVHNAIQVYFPTRLVDEPTRIYYSEQSDPVHEIPAGRRSLLNFSLDARNSQGDVRQFNGEYEIRFVYTDNQLVGLNEESIRLYFWDDETGSWQSMSSCQSCGVDLNQNTLTVKADHFTDFSVQIEVAEIASGQLVIHEGSITVSEAIVQFPDTLLTGYGQTVSASTTVTATDATGTGQGWYVNIQADDFVAEKGTIAVENLSMVLPEDALSRIDGNNLPHSNVLDYIDLGPDARVVLIANPGEGMGVFEFSPLFRLFIPASIYAGDYVSEVTLTIVPGQP